MWHGAKADDKYNVWQSVKKKAVMQRAMKYRLCM